MRLSRLFALASVALAGVIAAAACGDSEPSQPTATVAATSVPTTASGTPAPTSATSPTTVPVASQLTYKAGPNATVDDLKAVAVIGKYENENVRYGGTYKYATADSFVLDPKLNQSNGLRQNTTWFYEKLIDWTPNENDAYSVLKPYLAESWEVSKDLQTLTLKIRKGVKWHNIAPVNGREFVASDAAFSIERYRQKDSTAYASYSQIESVETPDKYTLVIKVKAPNAYIVEELFGSLEYIVNPELVAEGNGGLTTRAIGTGPYMLQKFEYRQGGESVRNPDYWRKDLKGNTLPYVDSVKVTYIADRATGVAAFRTGQIDNPHLATADDRLALARAMELRYFKIGIPAYGGQGMAFKSNKAPWNDVRVRRALNMLLDKARYNDIVDGKGRWDYSTPIPWNLVSDEPFTFDKLGPYYKYNPAEAKKLLIEAGFADGKMKLASPMAHGGGQYPDRALAFQALWKENGIEFSLLSQDQATYNPYYFSRPFQDIGLTHHIGAQGNLNWFALNKYHPDASQNTSWVNDPEMNKVITEVKVTIDPAKTKQLARFIWDFDTLGSYNIWMGTASETYSIVSAHTRNWTPRRGGGNGHVNEPVPWLSDAPRTSP